MMKQLIQSYKTGEMKLEEVPRPLVVRGTLLIETRASVVSAGTEKMIVELARKSLLGKAKSRPDLVRKVINQIHYPFRVMHKVSNIIASPFITRLCQNLGIIFIHRPLC